MTLLWLVSLVLLLLTVLLLALAYSRDRMDLFSYQSAFQLGMMVFFYGPLLLVPMFPELRWPYVPSGEGFTTMAIAMIVFNIVYLMFFSLGSKMEWPERVVPNYAFLPVSMLGLSIMTAGMLTASVAIYLVAFTPGAMNLFEAVLLVLIPSLGAYATGLATVLVLRQWYNAVWYVLLAAVFTVALLASVGFSADRRYALGVLIMIPWMLYYGWLRYKKKSFTLMVAGIGAAVAFSFVLIYSTFRHDSGVAGTSVAIRLEQAGSADLRKAFDPQNALGLFLQDTAYNSIYCIENYPNNKEYMPLHGLFYVITNPIPRAVFPAKPNALGIMMADTVGAVGNLGPGIIGHGWAEAHWIGILYYAAAFGVLIAIADRLIRTRANNPYFLAAMGANMGNAIALPRGEVALFVVQIGYGLIGTLVVSWIIARTAGSLAIGSEEFAFGSDTQIDEDEDNPAEEYTPDALPTAVQPSLKAADGPAGLGGSQHA
jgi:hypothetical protein